LQVGREEVAEYLEEVKRLIRKGNYQIAMNSNREQNRQLYTEYLIDEKQSEKILLDLQLENYAETVQNEHPKFSHEWLYIFGKTVELMRRFEGSDEAVPLYIKLNKIKNQQIIVISFHVQKYKLKYPY
jgi:hypothetical protein